MSAAAQWYYVSNDHPQGPVARDRLDALLASGVVTGDTLVWADGMAEWQPARNTALPIEARAPRPANLNHPRPQPATLKLRRFNRALALTCAACSYGVVIYMGVPLWAVARHKMTMLEALQFSDRAAGAAGLAAIVGAASFFAWSYRATRNLVTLKGAQSVTAAGAVYWYFVPIWTLWKPLQAMNNLRAGFGAGKAWTAYVWWALFWLSNLADAATSVVATQGTGLTIDSAYTLMAISNAAAIAFYVAGAQLVLDISKAEAIAITAAQER